MYNGYFNLSQYKNPPLTVGNIYNNNILLPFLLYSNSYVTLFKTYYFVLLLIDNDEMHPYLLEF